MCRCVTATSGGTIDDVIVEKSRDVQQLDGRRDVDMVWRRVVGARCHCSECHETRPHPLAATERETSHRIERGIGERRPDLVAAIGEIPS
jgi:hypothetical protein